MPESSILRLGTRDSALARWQATWVATQLQQHGYPVDLVPITTQGDRRREPIAQVGGTGIFTKELQQALLDRRIDLAVHSLKDLPTTTLSGLYLAAVPAREAVHDVWIARDGTAWSEVASGARVGTGSLRRRAQLLHHRPDLCIEEIRGNVDTRLRKLNEGLFNGIVLAAAGLNRLGLHDRITQVLPTSIMLPAVGQGALGIETRQDDRRAREACARLEDPATRAAVIAERSLLATLRGGCLAPIGAWARPMPGSADVLRLEAVVLSVDGQRRLVAAADGPLRDEPGDSAAVQLGQAVADDLLAQGASALLAAARTENS